jgi:hypothetical protein
MSKYNPTIKYNPSYPIYHKENDAYVKYLANRLYSNIKKTSKAYHLKHTGVPDRGAKGKVVTVTPLQLESLIRNSNGRCAISGVELFFGPPQSFTEPTKMLNDKHMTEDEALRRPSVDRINSSKGYTADNIQLTTMSSNAAKGKYSFLPTPTSENRFVSDNEVRFLDKNKNFEVIVPANYVTGSMIADFFRNAG